MNNEGVKKLGLGVEINKDNPKASLEKALLLAKGNQIFNEKLKGKYGTLDGIVYMAETILMLEQGKDISERLKKQPISRVC